MEEARRVDAAAITVAAIGPLDPPALLRSRRRIRRTFRGCRHADNADVLHPLGPREGHSMFDLAGFIRHAAGGAPACLIIDDIGDRHLFRRALLQLPPLGASQGNRTTAATFTRSRWNPEVSCSGRAALRACDAPLSRGPRCPQCRSSVISLGPAAVLHAAARPGHERMFAAIAMKRQVGEVNTRATLAVRIPGLAKPDPGMTVACGGAALDLNRFLTISQGTRMRDASSKL